MRSTRLIFPGITMSHFFVGEFFLKPLLKI
jgi:hypothetical protein